MKFNNFGKRLTAAILLATIFATASGCRSVKYRVDYVTSEYDVEIDGDSVQSGDGEGNDASGSDSTDVGNDTQTGVKSDGASSDEDGKKGNSFLSGGITTDGNAVSAEYVDNVLYTANPTFRWTKLANGQTVRITIKNSDGKTVLDKKGLTGTSYKSEKALENGKTYTVNMTYTDKDGDTHEMSSFGSTGKKMLCVAKSTENDSRDYTFKNSISLEVLNNYLDRAGRYSMIGDSYSAATFDEAARYLLNTGAKYVLRAGGQWYATNAVTGYSDDVENKLAQIHSVDPEIIFEACIFETTTSAINSIKIPSWVFEDFGLKAEDRNFNMNNTLFPAEDLDGDGVKEYRYGINSMGLNAHIPDITQTEHQMFVYYRACQYIDMGFEALHLGQVKLIGRNDKNDEAWTKVITMIRDYAKKHARRGYVLINAHGQIMNSDNGAMLVDMIVAPTRIAAAADEVDHAVSNNNPQRCDIFPSGSSDAPYLKHVKGTSPSGWTTDDYPYLVHLDNYDDGVGGDHTKKENIWGYDETTWFIKQPAWYRREFMEFLYNKISSYKDNGHLVLMMSNSSETSFEGIPYYSNNKSEYCPNGSGDEETIKSIFSRYNKK